MLLFSHSVVFDSLQPHGLQHGQASLSINNSRTPPKPMSIQLMMSSNLLILCHPLLLLHSIFASIRVFSNESAVHIRWPKYWSFSFNISPSNEYSGLISFRMDLLYLLVVQVTLECCPVPQFIQCWWEYNLVQPLCKTVWRFLMKLEIELLYDPTDP